MTERFQTGPADSCLLEAAQHPEDSDAAQKAADSAVHLAAPWHFPLSMLTKGSQGVDAKAARASLQMWSQAQGSDAEPEVSLRKAVDAGMCTCSSRELHVAFHV